MVLATTVGIDTIDGTGTTVGIMDFIILITMEVIAHTLMEEVTTEVVLIIHIIVTTIMHIARHLIGEGMVLHRIIFKMQLLPT